MPRKSRKMFDTPSEDTIAALRHELSQRGLDAFILPRFDAHQGEYVAPHDARLAFVTGFTGSAGMAIVTPDTVAVFVDGRYHVQVRRECSDARFSYHHIFNEPPEIWLQQNACEGWQVGYDAMHLPPRWFDRFDAACSQARAHLVAQQDNPVDAIWTGQPAPPNGLVQSMPTQLSGRQASDKCAAIATGMASDNLDFIVETQPDNIAWLLNVRGADVDFNPMPHSFTLIGQDRRVDWFVSDSKLAPGLLDELPDHVRIRPVGSFLPALQTTVGAGNRVLIDPDFSPVAVRHGLKQVGAIIVQKTSPLTQAKAIKNSCELEGMRACQIDDGLALTEFHAWLDETVPARAAAGQPVTEREAEDKVLELRRRSPRFLSESFRSISAAGGNAAMCHYSTSSTSNAPILPWNPYLLDSGGQYESGTTDVTRSYAFGTRPEGYDRAYTAVFKAFHALMTLRFPSGTQGHHIDAICRRPLWDLGLDYDHGTGHGVGHRLSVHEHPQRINKTYNPVDLVAGMVISIEPGHYVADLYGMRIENLVEIVVEADGFFAFRNLTWVPIQTDMLDPSELNEAERNWLNDYHAQLRTRLEPRLGARAKAWIERATAPI